MTNSMVVLQEYLVWLVPLRFLPLFCLHENLSGTDAWVFMVRFPSVTNQLHQGRVRLMYRKHLKIISSTAPL